MDGKKTKESFIKLNVDATFDPVRGLGGTGAILRNSSGYFLAAACNDISFVEDAAMEEARGPREGLILTNDMGCNN